MCGLVCQVLSHRLISCSVAGPLTNLINYVHDRGGYEGGDGDNFGVFSCGENDGENDGENTVKLL